MTTLLEVERRGEIHLLRIRVSRLTYPTLEGFFSEVRRVVDEGADRLVLDFDEVVFLDSPAIGCLMNIHRLLGSREGALRLCRLRPHLDTMVRLTGVHKVVGLHLDAEEALNAFTA